VTIYTSAFHFITVANLRGGETLAIEFKTERFFAGATASGGVKGAGR